MKRFSKVNQGLTVLESKRETKHKGDLYEGNQTGW